MIYIAQMYILFKMAGKQNYMQMIAVNRAIAET